MTVSQLALKAFNVPIDELPVTTDPDRINPVLRKINKDLSFNPNIDELPYFY